MTHDNVTDIVEPRTHYTLEYWHSEDYSGEHREWVENIKIPIGNKLVAEIQGEATAIIATLRNENATLAAGSCDVEGGKIGDEHGNFYCTLQSELATLRKQLSDAREALRGAACAIERGNLYETMCCSGQYCGCRGSSNADLVLHYIDEELKATS